MALERVRPGSADPRLRKSYNRAIAILIGGNAVLALMKGLLAWATGSSAIFSDAANSLADTLYSILLGVGLSLSQKPADISHPQGHSRFDPLVGMLVTAAMAGAGATALYESIQRFLGDDRTIPLPLPTLVLLTAALIKLVMYRSISRIGQKTGSPAIQAGAQDNLMDTITTASAMVGIWGARYLHPAADPVAGVLVALWIFRTTWRVGRQSLGYLTGRGAGQEVVGEIFDRAREVPGVESVHRVIADYVGPKLRVEIHVGVDGGITLEHAHGISEEVEARIKTLPSVDLVFVHVDPARKT